MLKLAGVEKRYGNHTILQHVSLEFQEGKLYILQGINGSGKSTLLKILAGVIYKTSGGIERGGRRISYLPDRYSMPRLMKVKSYIYEILSEDVSKSHVFDLMKKYQIPDRRIGALSKGNQQKVGLVQVFSVPADIYILDEPMDGLDEMAKHLVKDEIKNLLDNKRTVILSLHAKSFFNDLNPILLEVKDGEIHEKKKKS